MNSAKSNLSEGQQEPKSHNQGKNQRAEADWPGSVDANGGEGHGFTDTIRKMMVAGLGAVFMSESGVRALVKDIKLPKEVLGFMMGQAERSKSELLRVVGEELRRFLESAAFRAEISRLLSEVTLEVKAEIRLKPDQQESPDVKIKSVSAHKRRS